MRIPDISSEDELLDDVDEDDEDDDPGSK